MSVTETKNGNAGTAKLDSELENNMRLLLKEVTSPAERFNEETFKTLLIQQAQKAVQAFAYYDADISITDLVAASSSGASTMSLSYTVNIALGSKANVERIIFVNDLAQLDKTVFPSQLQTVIEQVQNLKGNPLNHKRYESLKSQLQTYALLYGYFDFSFPLHKLIVQPKTANATASTATIHWIFYFGRRYQFGELQFLEDTRGQDIASSVKTFKTGDYFEQGKLGDFSIDMQSTSYFSSAIARASAKNAVDYKVPIEVILEPKPKDTYEFGVGFSTDTGPRFTVDWSRPWVNLRGHSLGARLYISEPEQSADITYRIPKANPLNDFLDFQAGYSLVDNNETNSETLSLAIQRQWGAVEDDGWDQIAFIKFEQESFIQGSADETTTRLLLPGATLSRIRKRGNIFVDWGDLQQLTIEGGSKAIVSDIDFFKALARTKWVRQWNKHRLIVRADVGAIATNDFSRVPSSQRFFAGGDQSIRGFGLDDISAFEVVDGEKEAVGGRNLAVGSIEYAYRVAEKFRAAVFFDAGNASDNPLEDYAIGYGIGMHWLSPIGAVRVYIARGESDIEDSARLHIVIGPGL